MYQTNAPWSWSGISALENQINRHSAIVHWYQAWGVNPGNSRDFNPSLLTATRAHGSLPMITWEPWNGPPVTQNPFPLKQIAAGAFDSAYVDIWATGMRGYGRPVLLLFGHEMDGNWYPWGAGVNGNQPADYIAAYRHVHDRFRQLGATNVQWVWNPAGDPGSAYPPLGNFYPGDAYVDWLAGAGYNWGTTKSWSSWQSLSTRFQQTYARLTALSASKPVMLAEWASVEQGGDKGAWIQEATASIPRLFPRIRAVVWFSEANNPWALDSSPGSLAGARAAFGAAPYCATLPY